MATDGQLRAVQSERDGCMNTVLPFTHDNRTIQARIDLDVATLVNATSCAIDVGQPHRKAIDFVREPSQAELDGPFNEILQFK
jgi:hypothetical protein